MKSLTESILNTSGVGKTYIKSKIYEWIVNNLICSKDEFEIKNLIIYPKKDANIFLFRDNLYDELPEYIQFGDGNYNLILGRAEGGDILTEIKSFRGLPENVYKLYIGFDKNITTPELKIKTSKLTIDNVNIFNKNFKISYSEKYKIPTAIIQTVHIETSEIINIKNSTSKFAGFNKIILGKREKLLSSELYFLLKNIVEQYKKNPELKLSENQSLEINKIIKKYGFDESIIKIEIWSNRYFPTETVLYCLPDKKNSPFYNTWCVKFAL